MKRSILWTVNFLIGLALIAAAMSAQDRPDRQPEVSLAVRQAIITAASKYKIPGMAVAVINHGQLAGIEVYGVRDRDSNSPVAVNTVFEAGALGEPMFAYDVLSLAAEGRINAGTPLTSYSPLPYVRDRDALSDSNSTEPLYDPRFNQITAIQIMNHTSGMPDWAHGAHLELQSVPGEKWSYSNEGYLYLQDVIQHVTNESFNSFITRTVLGPARLPHSGFIWNGGNAGNMATGTDRNGAAVPGQRYSKPVASTTLYTTIEDYAHFVTFLLASAPAQRTHESAVSLMLSPTASVDKTLSWGLGSGLEQSGDDLFFFNSGSNPGFRAFVMASRKSGKGIVILTNSDRGFDAVPDIVGAAIGGNHPVLKSAFLHSPS